MNNRIMLKFWTLGSMEKCVAKLKRISPVQFAFHPWAVVPKPTDKWKITLAFATAADLTAFVNHSQCAEAYVAFHNKGAPASQAITEAEAFADEPIIVVSLE